eukprot:Blabericola_migrator_1__28@NODE_1008_length_5718_cov_50_473191_g567_i2_p2_GENE_NODE_1008_length_5718_cov_50_473191_g567_i2NODE_1008_length_5718_cov_50_473191_g567_i2_p2_ORF_typecomplete_len348_score36_69DUF2981/PF11200_8/8_3e14Mem_trans/PF03547_18/0_02_NODE_1008_length_5718_cov_50_473191_g567_i223283371
MCCRNPHRIPYRNHSLFTVGRATKPAIRPAYNTSSASNRGLSPTTSPPSSLLPFHKSLFLPPSLTYHSLQRPCPLISFPRPLASRQTAQSPPYLQTSADDIKPLGSIVNTTLAGASVSSFVAHRYQPRALPLRDVEDDIADKVAALLIPVIDEDAPTPTHHHRSSTKKRKYLSAEQSLLQRDDSPGEWAQDSGTPQGTATGHAKLSSGQKDEVSLNELPPEVNDLPEDLQKSITATTKTIKHLVKFVSGVILLGCGLWMAYTSWIITSFAMNRWYHFFTRNLALPASQFAICAFHTHTQPFYSLSTAFCVTQFAASRSMSLRSSLTNFNRSFLLTTRLNTLTSTTWY